MNISKALKEKNRIVGEMNRLLAQVVKLNSYRTTAADDPNPNNTTVMANFDSYLGLQESLIDLKAKIQQASAPIAELLVEIAEKKALLVAIGQIPAPLEKSVESSRYEGGVTTFYSRNAITENKISEMHTEIQARINQLQDSIDEFNAVTKV